MTRPSPFSRTLSCLSFLLVLGLVAAPSGWAAPSGPGSAGPHAKPSARRAEVPSPESFFGFRMGADNQLAAWPDIVKYFERVAETSDRVSLIDIGPSTEGNRMIGALVSAPDTIARLDAVRAGNRKLADPRTIDEAEAARLVASQKAVVAIGCSIHATEVAATQTANELLYELASANDERTLAILSSAVVLLIPSLNPDGHVMVVDWQRRYKGTKFEGGPMPWLYHKYAGHDINRDAFMLNLVENQRLTALFYDRWQPQVFLSMHQMGSNGARLFVPPNYDPVDPNHDPLIWRTAGLLGGAMAYELESKGRAGVLSNAMYDYFWPGYEDSAPIGRNTVCLLTEAASVRLAAPIDVDPKSLVGTPKGLPAYGPQVNFPNPWPGGKWTLRDIVDYELDAARGLLGAVARYREQILGNFYAMGRHAVDRGRAGGPFAYVIPPDQFDPWAASRLVGVLVEGRIEVHRAASAFRVADTVYPAGSTLVLMAQPARAFAKTLLERQVYPVRRLAPNLPPERPYDVAGWTLPAQMGVRVDQVEAAFELPALERLDRAPAPAGQVWGDRRPDFLVVEARGTGGAVLLNRFVKAGLTPSWTPAPLVINGYTYPAGSLVVRNQKGSAATAERLAVESGQRADRARGRLPQGLVPVGAARVALYKPWTGSIDEGWTRWLLERYEFPFQPLTDAEVRRGALRDRFDVIVLPSLGRAQIVAGNKPDLVPAEYAGGIGDEGVAAMKAFVEAGGTLVAIDASANFAIEALGLPVRNALSGLKPEQFFCPGSVLRLAVDAAQPLGFGMPAETSAFFTFGSAFEPATPEQAGRMSVVARYGARDVLISGWLEGETAIAGKPAVVEVRQGAGRAVLIGFRAQHRGQSLATFRLLFNAVFTTPAARPAAR